MTETETVKGASNGMCEDPSLHIAEGARRQIADQRLIAAAREDNEDMLLEIFDEGGFDINYKDGCVHASPSRTNRLH